MNNYYKFMKWCDINNNAFLRFNTTEKNLKAFGDLISDLYKSDKMINEMKCISKLINNKVYNNKVSTRPSLDFGWVGNTTRMSCIEMG